MRKKYKPESEGGEKEKEDVIEGGKDNTRECTGKITEKKY